MTMGTGPFSPSSKGLCMPICGARARSNYWSSMPGAMRSGGFRWVSRVRYRLRWRKLLRRFLPADRPRYVMGVGMPEELAEYVARGVDMMDCVLPSRNARNGCLFTRAGKISIKQTQYKDDDSRWMRTAGAIRAGTFRGLICGICFRRGK